MITQLLPSKINPIHAIAALVKKDIVFSASLFLALASCFIALPRTSYINFKVIVCLFNLMLVVKAFEELHVLDKIAIHILNQCTDSRKVSFILILLSFFTAMLVTNDVALITLVPLALIISKKSNINMLLTVILQTLAANIGSSLTPMGNPQNLYIFSYYQLTALQFFVPILLFAISGLLWLYILNHRSHNIKLDMTLAVVEMPEKVKTIIWAVLFGIIILSVFEIIKYQTALILTLAVTLRMNRKLIYKIDYPLLMTFICFFIFIGNVSSIHAIDNYMRASLSSGPSTYFTSILLSQFISNVPCAIFLSNFTMQWKALLLGVNVGGMGTLIASLASVISYKLFIKENPHSHKKYILKFSIYNVISLVVFTVINYFIVIL